MTGCFRSYGPAHPRCQGNLTQYMQDGQLMLCALCWNCPITWPRHAWWDAGSWWLAGLFLRAHWVQTQLPVVRLPAFPPAFFSAASRGWTPPCLKKKKELRGRHCWGARLLCLLFFVVRALSQSGVPWRRYRMVMMAQAPASLEILTVFRHSRITTVLAVFYVSTRYSVLMSILDEVWITNLLFFASRPLVHVTWSCLFIIPRWEGENLYRILELGRCPFCKWNRWKNLERIYLSIGWIMETTNSTARAKPARNPGTPRPGARRHGKRKHNHRQTRSRAHWQRSTDIQLSRAVTRFSSKRLIHKPTKRMQVWNTNPVLSLNRKQGLPRMTPGLPATYSACKCSPGKRQLQGDEGSAVQKRIGSGHTNSVQLINLVLGYPEWPQACLVGTVNSILQSKKLWFSELPGMTPGLLSKRTICVAKYITNASTERANESGPRLALPM